MPPPRGLVQHLDAHLHRTPLLPRHGRLLVACSGGADSVALLHLLHAINQSNYWHWHLIVAHINHQLRGQASTDDAKFVKKLSQDLHLKCHIAKVTVKKNKQGQTSEAAARTARLHALETLAHKTNCPTIVLAHHADDQAETVLLRLLRGCGVRGLSAMRPQRRTPDLAFVRPLLEVTRQTLRHYLQQNHLSWREDATNAHPTYLRNRIRQELLPLLESYQPRVRETLSRLAVHAHEAHTTIRREVHRLHRRGILQVTPQHAHLFRADLAKASPAAQRSLLREALVALGAHPDQINFTQMQSALGFIATWKTGQRLGFSQNLMLRFRRDHIEITREQP